MEVRYLGNSASGRLLAERLREVDSTKVIHWGTLAGLRGWQQLERLQDAGLEVPTWTKDNPMSIDDSAFFADYGNWVGRCNSHTQGKDIIVYPTITTDIISHTNLWYKRIEKWRNSDYWVRWLPEAISAQEWRIHILGGRSIARALKVQVGEIQPSGRQQGLASPIRSRRLGWRMRHAVEAPKGVRTAAKKAVEALGYPWGAVDLLVWPKAEEPSIAGRIVVLDVNSMPGLGSPMVIEAWVEGLKEWASKD